MKSLSFPENKNKRWFVVFSGTLAGGIFGLVLYHVAFISGTIFSAIVIFGGLFAGFIASSAISLEKTLSEQEIISAKNVDENKAKDGLISMVLHHIRTPLTGMMWSIKELATEAPMGGLQKDRLLRLYDENVRVLNMLEQIIKTAQANMGHVSYSFVDMSTEDLERLMSESISKMRPVAYAKHISVEIETLPLSKRIVKVDKDKIITVVQTLFENAVTYTRNEGDIRIHMEEKQNDFLFHISDSGIGIPEPERGKIFSQFFRSSNAKQERPNGVGIGLFLARTFVKSHGGDITFISKSKGTTFTVRLPIFVPKKPQSPAATNTEHWRGD